MDWHPITVATVIEDQGRFLLVEELKAGRLVLNQPAGHLEANENLREAAIRETLERNGLGGRAHRPGRHLPVYRPEQRITYQRVCFAAKAVRHDAQRPLDDGIVAARWLSREELAQQPERWRSELVPRCIDDYLAGPLHPLDVIRN